SVQSAVGALASPALTTFTVPVRYAPQTTVGIALANLNAAPNLIDLKLIDQNGSLVGEDSLTLGSFSQNAFPLDTRQSFHNALTTSAGFLGALLVTAPSTTQPVAAMVVGFQKGQFYSLPVSQSEIGRASCRERVYGAVVEAIIKKNAVGRGFLALQFITNLSDTANTLNINRISQNGLV